MRLSLFTALAALMLGIHPGFADQLVHFSFSSDLTPSQKSAQISAVTPLRAVLSAARQDGFTESARANTWHLSQSTNYYAFSFAVEAGYVADIEGLQFDFMSQKAVSTTNGPTQYNVSVGLNGAAFNSISGGWKTMAADGVWHRGVAATNGGLALNNLTGNVTIALAAKGAKGDKSRWYVDNLTVIGRIRPQTRLPVQPRITAMAPRRALLFSGISPDQYYSVQYATSLASEWEPFPGAMNLTTNSSSLLADIAGINSPSLFLRGVTSFDRLPSVDLGGFWRVTSTPSLFGNGVIRFEQDGGAINFEQSLLGRISDSSFAIGENGADWMSGSVTGDALSGRYALLLAGTNSTGILQAERYTGPMYEVWQGTNALTPSLCLDPGTNGYTRIGQSSTTATFVATQPYIVVYANTLAPIDAIAGPEDAFLNPVIVSSFSTSNTVYLEQMYGLPDGQSAWVGSTYSGGAYRGYVAFGPVSWSSLTVHIGLPQVPTNAPPEPYWTNLLAQTFYLEYDSDGSSPMEDAEIALMFEPNGVAQVYAAFPDYAISYRGSYSYTNQQLSLKFSDEDFYPEVKFAMDLTSPKVNMPFDVFTTGTTGPSRWRRENASISHNLWIVFQGATVNEKLSLDEGLRRARAYAEALVQPDTVPGTLHALDLPADDGRKLIKTEPMANGILLYYRLPDGTQLCLEVVLLDNGNTPNGPQLTAGPLSADPHVYLNVQAGANGKDDPKVKKALLIAPFYSRPILTINPGEPSASPPNQDMDFLELSDMVVKLKSRGYEVISGPGGGPGLLDQNASVETLIRELRKSPGLICYFTHGGSDGLLSTGTFLGTESTRELRKKAWAELQSRLIRIKEQYRDLPDYQDAAGNTIPVHALTLPNGMTGKDDLWMLCIRPAFWSWLRDKQGADFSSSLVYIGACHTSETNSLRHAIRAKTLFSFDGAVNTSDLCRIGRYLVHSLARPTFTAEETYYNILRVLRTRQMIYAQDTHLQNIAIDVANQVHGYVTMGPNYDSSPNGIMSYADCGWVEAAAGNLVDAGNVWWLLFTGRWGQNAQDGANQLLHCWDLYWELEKRPPLGDVGCTQCDPGKSVKRDEVAYATYLLIGEPVVPFSGIIAPRWTLNDGARQ